MDTTVFDAVFWSFFITAVAGFLLKCAGMAYKSKCSQIDFCCVKITRNTELEAEEEEFRLTHPPPRIPPSPSADNV